jgi:hypothetical protein
MNSNPKSIHQRAKQIDLLKNIMSDSNKHKRIAKQPKANKVK